MTSKGAPRKNQQSTLAPSTADFGERPDARAPVSAVEFLDRAAYRQRRMRDAAHVLPVLAILLMLLPLMWTGQNTGQHAGQGGEEAHTSFGMIYLFSVWVGMVVLSFTLSLVLRFPDGPRTAQELSEKHPVEAKPISADLSAASKTRDGKAQSDGRLEETDR